MTATTPNAPGVADPPALVTLAGMNFGSAALSPSAAIGGRPCAVLARTCPASATAPFCPGVTDGTLVCEAPAAVGYAGLHVAVAAAAWGEMERAFTYDGAGGFACVRPDVRRLLRRELPGPTSPALPQPPR